MEMLFLLVLAHLLADYPLQGDFMSKAKNHLTPIPGVSPWTMLFSHGFIHAGFVWLITESVPCALIEFFVHCAIDRAKCSKWISFNTDQTLHIICKIAYVYYLEMS